MGIKIIELSKKFNNKSIINNLNLEIEHNKITAIIGPSGCGKTTLLNILSGVEMQDKGNIEGIENYNISYIFQEPRLLEWLTVYENIEFVLKSVKNIDINIDSSIMKYLKIVGLQEYKDYYPKELSGGMKQRVSIARAFSYPSELLLMDEPFSGIDYSLKNNLIMDFINIYLKYKKTVVFVTHNIEEALLLSNNIKIMSNQPAKIINNIKIDIELFKRKLDDMQKYKNQIISEMDKL